MHESEDPQALAWIATSLEDAHGASVVCDGDPTNPGDVSAAARCTQRKAITAASSAAQQRWTGLICREDGLTTLLSAVFALRRSPGRSIAGRRPCSRASAVRLGLVSSRPSKRTNGPIWLGVAMLVAAAVVVGIIAINSAGSGSPTPQLATTAHRDKPHSKPRVKATKSLLVRNATPQPSWRKYTGPVPFLVYHALGPAPANAPFPGLY